jgi:hypothetical protein
MRVSSWVATQLAGSQEGLGSMSEWLSEYRKMKAVNMLNHWKLKITRQRWWRFESGDSQFELRMLSAHSLNRRPHRGEGCKVEWGCEKETVIVVKETGFQEVSEDGIVELLEVGSVLLMNEEPAMLDRRTYIGTKDYHGDGEVVTAE